MLNKLKFFFFYQLLKIIKLKTVGIKRIALFNRSIFQYVQNVIKN